MELRGGAGGRERFAGAAPMRLYSGGGAQRRRSAMGRGYCGARSDSRVVGATDSEGTRFEASQLFHAGKAEFEDGSGAEEAGV